VNAQAETPTRNLEKKAKRRKKARQPNAKVPVYMSSLPLALSILSCLVPCIYLDFANRRIQTLRIDLMGKWMHVGCLKKLAVFFGDFSV